MGINESTVKHLNYFTTESYQNDVKVYSGLVSLYMHFDLYSCETSFGTLRSHTWLRNHVT